MTNLNIFLIGRKIYILFTKCFFKFFNIILCGIIEHCIGICRCNRVNCITNRAQVVSSNTETFKFSTTHSIILIISLVKEIIWTSSFSLKSSNRTHHFLNSTKIIFVCVTNIIKITTTKIFFYRRFISKNSHHTIKYFIISRSFRILKINIKFSKFF